MEHNGARRSQLLTPANIVTLARICLVPVFVAALLSPWPEWLGLHDIINDETKSLVAAAVFIFISCTDWLDGYLARKRDEVTDFGKFVDPLADKILVAAALLALVQLQVLPSWPVLIILGREFIVSGVRMIAASKNEVIAASWYGKAKTVAQIVAIVMFLVKDSLYLPNVDYAIHNPLYVLSWLAMLVALALTIISMLDYIAKARHLLGFRTAAGADPAASTAVVPDDACLQRSADKVIRQAQERKLTIGTAESLTGGMVSSLLTSVPGSSAVVRGGIASYAAEVKADILGVDPDLLRVEGAVNAPTAIQMACGACKVLDADIAVSATGIAGPTGAEPDKPVGTVWLGVSVGDASVAEEAHFKGDRDAVRRHAAHHALELLHDAIARYPR